VPEVLPAMKIVLTVETITKPLADKYLKTNPFWNRKPDWGIVDKICRLLRAGHWRVNGESVVFDRNGHLVNGQHRLMAVSKTGISIQTVVVRGIDPKAFADSWMFFEKA
jgi:hypothetical protein